jgi:hypothetical protein
MGLSCSCGEWEGDGWFYELRKDDFVKLDSNRARRCKSCNELIDVGDECLKFRRFRATNTDIEIKIFGEAGLVELAPWYHCATCGEQYLNLDALGYCLNISENMLELLAEHRAMHGIVLAA